MKKFMAFSMLTLTMGFVGCGDTTTTPAPVTPPAVNKPAPMEDGHSTDAPHTHATPPGEGATPTDKPADAIPPEADGTK